MDREQYLAQVTLLLDCLPALKNQSTFALKGGTAINFFIQDLPRLSVDIDLTYVKTEQRAQAISKIEEGLKIFGESIVKYKQHYQIKELKTRTGQLSKITVTNGRTRVKIEPNFIMRGTLLPPVKMDIQQAVENKFAYSIKDIPVLAEEELYAGKICAALSRQHPRDFFDIKNLFEKQGITDAIRQAFVIYLVCAPKPIHEMLNPNLITLNSVFQHEFTNMTEHPITLDSLLDTRENLIKIINTELSDTEKMFILSVKQGEPDYSLMPFSQLDKLPALKWKIINIQKMARNKHILMMNNLKAVLNL